MTEQELRIIKECLDAAVNGPFFEDWEFHTLMGFTREEIAAVEASWPSPPTLDLEDDAVNNVLGNLLGYPHGVESRWHKYLTPTREQVAQVRARWRSEYTLDRDPEGTRGWDQ
ncbi:hypothetical protein [Kitasatospora sp. MAA19]|uniref:hypothetical protein n=1 Tax=Kitasatospora sp. MAA19 TaxID=3035090 RepID=UPI00247611A7|nr:hypothetical protein [Kitasatospora sp. MAA19]